jgi:uncharacterized protein YlbG (UPF0298 family)
VGYYTSKKQVNVILYLNIDHTLDNLVHSLHNVVSVKIVLGATTYATAKVSGALYEEIELSKYRSNYPSHGAYHFKHCISWLDRSQI